jgi:hypothetical protein
VVGIFVVGIGVVGATVDVVEEVVGLAVVVVVVVVVVSFAKRIS